MAWPKHMRFVFRGNFDGTPEQWSFGCHFKREYDLGSDVGYGDIDAAAVTQALVNYLGAVSASTVVATDWRAYRIEATGKLAPTDQPLLTLLTPGTVHGTGQPVYPPQIALKVTTVANERGPAQRGGWFIPGPKALIDTGDLRLTAAQALGMASVSSSFLKAISDAIDVPGTVVSAEGVNVSQGPPGSTGGTLQTIDHVEVGRVYDTIRNRRKSMDEDRQVNPDIDW